MQPLPPNIGRYVVEELVGVGGMGQIYKAQDPVLRRTVAIKLISTKLMSGADRPPLSTIRAGRGASEGRRKGLR